MAESTKYDRIFRVLEYLARHPSGATLSTIARDVGMPLSSCHDVLQRLEAISAISMSADRQYRLGGRSRALAASITESEHLLPVSRRYLAALARELGFDVYIAVTSLGRVTYVDRFRGSHPVNVNVPLGQPLAIHATAAGKLFAAYDERTASIVLSGTHDLRKLTPKTNTDRDKLRQELAAIVRNGYSQSDEEAILGVTGLAVPVFDTGGALLAALHVSALTAELSPSTVEHVLERMRETSANIGRDAS